MAVEAERESATNRGGSRVYSEYKRPQNNMIHVVRGVCYR